MSGKFIAQINFNGAMQRLGRFDEERNAAIIYDFKAIELYGKYAKTNLIENPNQ